MKAFLHEIDGRSVGYEGECYDDDDDEEEKEEEEEERRGEVIKEDVELLVKVDKRLIKDKNINHEDENKNKCSKSLQVVVNEDGEGTPSRKDKEFNKLQDKIDLLIEGVRLL